MKISQKIIREHVDLTVGTVVVVREALGQQADYDVYRLEPGAPSSQFFAAQRNCKYLGGGTKREALALFKKAASQ